MRARRCPRSGRWVLALCRRRWLAAALCLAPVLPLPAMADGLWQPVADRTLEAMRGGFSLGGGLEVSFGITRAVYINGELVVETTLNLSRLAELGQEAVAQLQQLQQLQVVQNGPGNTVVTGAAPSPSKASGDSGPTVSAVPGVATGTVIQNSLNNQQILHQTIINATSNGLGLMRLSTLHETLSEAIRQSIGQN